MREFPANLYFCDDKKSELQSFGLAFPRFGIWKNNYNYD